MSIRPEYFYRNALMNFNSYISSEDTLARFKHWRYICLQQCLKQRVEPIVAGPVRTLFIQEFETTQKFFFTWQGEQQHPIAINRVLYIQHPITCQKNKTFSSRRFGNLCDETLMFLLLRNSWYPPMNSESLDIEGSAWKYHDTHSIFLNDWKSYTGVKKCAHKIQK